MTVERPIIKHLAAVIAFVMITGVALPAAAQACMMMERSEAMPAACCPVPDLDAYPCHGESAPDQQETPDHRHSEEMVCCSPEAAVMFDEAVRVEVNESAVPGLLARVSLESEVPVPPQVILRGIPESYRSGGGSAIGLHVLYGVMLN